MSKVEIIERVLAEILATEETAFLVEVEERKNDKFVVYLDDDKGLTLDMVVQYSDILRPRLESLPEFADGNFILEVSSASLERPLKLLRQYRKNLQRNLKICLQNGSILQGKLTAVNDAQIKIITPKHQTYDLDFQDIKASYVQPF